MSNTIHTVEGFWSRVIAFAETSLTIRRLSALSNLTDEERFMVYEGNARRVFGRLDAALKLKGK